MASDLLALSARFIDEDVYEGPPSVNRVTQELSEVADGVVMVESFSHVVVFDTDAGLVLFDTSLGVFGERVRAALREWSHALVHTIVYTHGHVDHVGGARTFVAEAEQRGLPAPHVVGHEAVAARFDRYDLTNGWNAVINQRQFGPAPGLAMSRPVWPRDWVRPGEVFRTKHRLSVGGLDMELRHARGETDDHLWAWLPASRTIVSGDFFTWVFPNAGNPQKVQRYPGEWAAALREMAAMDAQLLLPAHGLPVAGAGRIRAVLTDAAAALEAIVEQTVALMNEGARLDDIVATVAVPSHLLDRPYLRPVYDEPEFVVRNVWRQYGGWYDGNPAHLKPAPHAALASELASLAGSAAALARRGLQLAEAGELRLACHLVELAFAADPTDDSVRRARTDVYTRRRRVEQSLMAKGIFGTAAAESAEPLS
jgi:alkyl sulfatase BDS1-like metallo-beta-lactamase superfamily hydrolase